MEKKKIVFIYESLFESITTDVFTFLCLAVLYELNHQYIHSVVFEILIFVMLFIGAISLGNEKEMTPREAYEFLKVRFENEDTQHAVPEQKVQRKDTDGDPEK